MLKHQANKVLGDCPSGTVRLIILLSVNIRKNLRLPLRGVGATLSPSCRLYEPEAVLEALRAGSGAAGLILTKNPSFQLDTT